MPIAFWPTGEEPNGIVCMNLSALQPLLEGHHDAVADVDHHVNLILRLSTSARRSRTARSPEQAVQQCPQADVIAVARATRCPVRSERSQRREHVGVHAREYLQDVRRPV